MKKQKLINFKKNEDFQKDLQAGELLETSIIFVDDTKKIYTHGTEFDCSGEADWNAEEGEAGFIKNKPVIEESGDELIYKNTITATNLSTGYAVYTHNALLTILEDEKYKVIIDNKEYVVIGKIPNSSISILSTEAFENNPFVGEFSIFAQTNSNNTIFAVKSSTSPITYNIEIYHITGESKKQLDPSYLPIVQETGDSETSIMSQKAVTEALANVGGSSEVNADWDAEEGDPGFIKNKPIVEVEREKLVYQNQFEKSYAVYGLNFAQKKIEYDDFERILKLGDKYIIYVNNVKFDCICFCLNGGESNYKHWILSSDNSSTHPANKPEFLICEENAGLPKGFEFYWKQEFGDEVELKIYHITEGVKQLDPSYLPIVQETGDSETSIMSQKAVTEALANVGGSSDVNADWNAEEGESGFIKNKPFGYEYELVFSADNISITNQAGNGYAGYNLNTANFYDYDGIYKVVLNNQIFNNIKGYGAYLSNDYTGSPQPLYQNSDFIIMNFGSASGQLYTKERYEDLSIRIYKLNKKQLDPSYLPIVQETGDSETSIMSQKAVTNAIPKMWTGTQDEYDAITSKDSNTFYFIKEEA